MELTQPVNYLPFENRTVDTNYNDLLAYIMKNGEEKYSPFHKEHKKRISGYVMRFNMENGFPVITERRMSEKLLKGAIGEIIGFANGARTLEELEKYGCQENSGNAGLHKKNVLTSDYNQEI